MSTFLQWLVASETVIKLLGFKNKILWVARIKEREKYKGIKTRILRAFLERNTLCWKKRDKNI